MKVLSLFSGIGSPEKALTNIGIDYEVVGFSEIDRWAIESYSAIHGIPTELNLGDVSEIDETNLPKIDMVTFGFPCTDITNSGFEAGIKEGTSSGLLFEAERIIKHTQPKYAIAENVRNLVGKGHKKDFEKLLTRLDSYGYNNYWKVLNATDFGIPQRRERVFIVSIRKDVDTKTFKMPQENFPNSKLIDFLDSSVEEKYYLKDHQLGDLIGELADGRVSVREATKKGYDVAEVGDSINIAFLNSKTRRGRVGKEVAQTLDTQPTIATLEGGHRIRKLSPLEYWRLMGFVDEDYWTARRRLESKFYNEGDRSNSQMYKQAGNAIVVDVLEQIFKELLGV